MAEISEHPAAREGMKAPTRLTAGHDLSQFSSGKPTLDDWLKKRALESEGRTARTYVVCDRSVVVVGYYCITMGSVERRDLPPQMRRVQGLPNQIPVAIIGRLARQDGPEWKGLGGDLLQDALKRILNVAEDIGVRAVLVHALDDDAAGFWRAFDFIECPVDSQTFYLPVETIIDAIA